MDPEANPRWSHRPENDPKCARTGAMDAGCPRWEQGPWAGEMPVADRFGVWACFDDEERSDTYTEQVGGCPGCGARLNAHALSAAHEKVRPW